MNIYDKEILELKKQILIETSNELKNIINFKIKKNTKAYRELEKTIFQWNLKINEITNNINQNAVNENFSFIKIDRKTLELIINLKNKLNFKSIAELLDILTIRYEEMFIKDSLIEIKSFDLNKKTQIALNNTDLYMCELVYDEYGINSNEKILYKIDDVMIYENKEYLDSKILRKYPIGEVIFWISLNCTLEDIEKFRKYNYWMFFNEAATLQFLQKVKLIIATTKNMKEYEILNQFIENEYTVESLYL